MSPTIRNDPDRPSGGHALLEGPGLAGVVAVTVENVSSGLFLSAGGRWAKLPYLFPVEAEAQALRLGPTIVDHVPEELLVALRSSDGRDLGRLFWQDVMPSRGRPIAAALAAAPSPEPAALPAAAPTTASPASEAPTAPSKPRPGRRLRRSLLPSGSSAHRAPARPTRCSTRSARGLGAHRPAGRRGRMGAAASARAGADRLATAPGSGPALYRRLRLEGRGGAGRLGRRSRENGRDRHGRRLRLTGASRRSTVPTGK